MATITVNVTQEDIDNGVRSDCNRCMVALALSRALGGKVVGVGLTSATCPPAKTLGPGLPYQAFRFPDEVAKRIDAFDDGEDVEPFKFEAEVADKVWV